MIWFCKKGKLSPRYDGPYEVLQGIGNIASELKLPSELASIHPVFHASIQIKCRSDLVRFRSG